MSLNLNQRIDTFKKPAFNQRIQSLALSCSALGMLLSVGVYSPPVNAKSLLEVKSSSAVMQANGSFEQILQQVRTYQAQQSGWHIQQQMTEAQLKQSRLWANPSLSIEQTGWQTDQDRELAIGISQPLDLFGQRKAAQAVARLTATQIDLDQQRYDAELELIVQFLWSQAALLELEKSVLLQQLQVSQQNLEASEQRYRAGSIAQVDVDRIRLAHLENQRVYQQAALQQQVAHKQLAQLWGDSQTSLSINPSVDELWTQAIQIKADGGQKQNMLERDLQLQTQRQQAHIQQLKAQSRPQPIMTLGVNRTRSADQNSENQVRLGVEIPLNIFNKQKYGIQIAEAKQTLIQQQQYIYRQHQQMDMQVHLAELNGLQAQFQQLNEQQIPLAVQVQQKTLQGFRLGKFSVTEVQQATTQLQDVRLRKVQLLKQAWQLSMQLQSARMGVDVEQITAKDALMQLNQRMWQQRNTFPAQTGE